MRTHPLRLALALLVPGLLLRPALAGELEIGGHVETNHYVGLVYGDLFDYGNTNVFGLKLQAQVNPDVVAVGNLELRHRGFTSATTSALLGDRDSVEPLGLRMQEAYVDLYALGTEYLDLRVGKQVITWGTADGMNPTSYLAPLDLENPLDFSTRLGVPALLATFYFPADLTVSAAVVPVFTPSLLPVDLFAAEMDVPFELPDYVELGSQRDRLEFPATQVRSTQVALRLAANVFDVDLSLSYFYGYQTLPQLAGIDVYDLDLSQSPWLAHVEASLAYPKTQAIGFDAATSLFGVGLWVEGAVFLPEELIAEVTLMGDPNDPLTGEPLPAIPVISGDPYLKLVAGLDYTLPGGLYLNLQYLHGFFHELTAENIQNYALMALRYSVLDDSLTFELRLGGELHEGESLGGLAGMEIGWQPSDAVKLTLGGLAARGDAGTTFDGFSSLDQIYLRARADF
ncbi:MAG: hypothetical protein P1V51_07655 [Deltaproteobacteria bacterium]|nr:hypothetical protein [Deltaproteobacteria bacterium]